MRSYERFGPLVCRLYRLSFSVPLNRSISGPSTIRVTKQPVGGPCLLNPGQMSLAVQLSHFRCIHYKLLLVPVIPQAKAQLLTVELLVANIEVGNMEVNDASGALLLTDRFLKSSESLLRDWSIHDDDLDKTWVRPKLLIRY